jgi:threonine dehydrogenase-like Zn-dependent dehydrogenase
MEKGVFDLRPLVTHVMPPERASEMFEIAAHQSDGYIKGVIRW